MSFKSEEGLTSSLLVIDGGFATQLVEMGYTNLFGDPLWSSRLLATDPAAVKLLHRLFLDAGADIVITNTYQASLDGFQKHLGMSAEDARQLMAKAVRLAVEARDEFWEDFCKKDNSSKAESGRRKPLVAGSIGAYGACLCDGSEYTGVYVDTKDPEDMVEYLKQWHRPRMEILVNSGVDLLAFETLPAVLEAKALVELLREFPHSRAWVAYSCKDGGHTHHGEPMSQAVEAVLDCDQVVAVGVNCTAPEHVTSLLQGCRKARDNGKAVIVYPNSGEKWSAEKHWFGKESLLSIPSYTPTWLKEGATWIGGCCRVFVDEIKEVRGIVDGFSQKKA